jgi:hypothetical protein
MLLSMSLTIEEFHILLASEKDDNPLLTALRELVAIKKPEEIAAAISESGFQWLPPISD